MRIMSGISRLYRTSGAATGPWSLEVVELLATPDDWDGGWYRLRRDGVYIADVRAVAELEWYFPLAELSTEDMALACIAPYCRVSPAWGFGRTQVRRVCSIRRADRRMGARWSSPGRCLDAGAGVLVCCQVTVVSRRSWQRRVPG